MEPKRILSKFFSLFIVKFKKLLFSASLTNMILGKKKIKHIDQ